LPKETRSFVSSVVCDVGYMGARGKHLTLYDINIDQIPDQYMSLGSALLFPAYQEGEASLARTISARLQGKRPVFQ
jgi:hypothetical protein